MEVPIKLMFMSAAEMRQAVHAYVDHIDEHFLQIVHSMMETYAKQHQLPVISTQIEGIPVTDEEVMQSIEKGEDQIAAGAYYTVDQLKEKAGQWLSTKS